MVKGSGNEVRAATGPGPGTGLHDSRDGLAGAGPEGRPTWGRFSGKACRSVRTLLSIWSTLMASRDGGGQGGQLGKMREGGEEEEPASNQRGQAERP